MAKRFATEDLVFAKVKGYPPWPAQVVELDESSSQLKYKVKFFGSNDISFCKPDALFKYGDYKEEYGIPQKRKAFNDGLIEAEKVFQRTCSSESKAATSSTEQKLVPRLILHRTDSAVSEVSNPSVSEVDDIDKDDHKPRAKVFSKADGRKSLSPGRVQQKETPRRRTSSKDQRARDKTPVRTEQPKETDGETEAKKSPSTSLCIVLSPRSSVEQEEQSSNNELEEATEKKKTPRRRSTSKDQRRRDKTPVEKEQPKETDGETEAQESPSTSCVVLSSRSSVEQEEQSSNNEREEATEKQATPRRHSSSKEQKARDKTAVRKEQPEETNGDSEPDELPSSSAHEVQSPRTSVEQENQAACNNGCEEAAETTSRKSAPAVIPVTGHHSPSKVKPNKKAQTLSTTNSFAIGDKVFAKVRSYPPWPAEIRDINIPKSGLTKYIVHFYGSNETASCKKEHLFKYLDYKSKYGKPLKRKFFNEAIAEIERSLGNNPDVSDGEPASKKIAMTPNTCAIHSVPNGKHPVVNCPSAMTIANTPSSVKNGKDNELNLETQEDEEKTPCKCGSPELQLPFREEINSGAKKLNSKDVSSDVQVISSDEETSNDKSNQQQESSKSVKDNPSKKSSHSKGGENIRSFQKNQFPVFCVKLGSYGSDKKKSSPDSKKRSSPDTKKRSPDTKKQSAPSSKQPRVSKDLTKIKEASEQAFRKKKYADLDDKTKEALVCTACHRSLRFQVRNGRDIYVHPLLKVLLCEDCLNVYGDGNFSVDEDGSDMYCRWCSEGGSLYCCSLCTYAFCKKCVKKNLDSSVLADIEKDDWRCFMCNPEPLTALRDVCSKAQEFLAVPKGQDSASTDSKLPKNNGDNDPIDYRLSEPSTSGAKEPSTDATEDAAKVTTSDESKKKQIEAKEDEAKDDKAKEVKSKNNEKVKSTKERKIQAKKEEVNQKEHDKAKQQEEKSKQEEKDLTTSNENVETSAESKEDDEDDDNISIVILSSDDEEEVDSDIECLGYVTRQIDTRKMFCYVHLEPLPKEEIQRWKKQRLD